MSGRGRAAGYSLPGQDIARMDGRVVVVSGCQMESTSVPSSSPVEGHMWKRLVSHHEILLVTGVESGGT